MTAITHILTGTDLSAPARHAVERAFRLAGELDARLTVMHVVSQGALGRVRELLGQQSAPVETSILSDAQQELGQLTAELGAKHQGVTVELSVSAGAAPQQLIAQADSCDTSLLVVGARGESMLRDLVIGSTAERMLRKTTRAVLVVRQPAEHRYRRVIVPIDFSPASTRALALARTIAPTAELVLFHAVIVPFEGKLRFAGVDIKHHQFAEKRQALEQLNRLVADAGLEPGSYRLVASPVDAVTGILDQATEDEADLIVIGKHGRSRTEELLLGSVTTHVLFGARCDVLVGAREFD